MVNISRPPIVAILGHVDHGKTTLLDFIKKTHRAAGEAGGITQGIGAYQAEFQGKKITFIDTPGHAAFSQMRSRGASIADLAVLVVAADDGVKPQTIESIKHLKAAGIPYVVAINKIDLPDANPETTKASLTSQEVFVEGYGGNIPFVLLSGKTGKGVDNLLETILLLAELENLKSDSSAVLKAPIVEAKKDNSSGNLVSVIVHAGTLKIGDEIVAGKALGKVKALFNDAGTTVKEALPGEPVQILGWNTLPEVGDVVTIGSEISSELSAIRNEVKDGSELGVTSDTQKLNIILKADTLGSLEAIRGSFPPEVNIILESTGDVTESDILLASTTKSIILSFNSRLSSNVKRLAETEKVKILSYKIIYELLEFIEKKILRLLEPNWDEVILGEGSVIKLFEINKEKIAGVKVTSGILSTGNTVHIKKEGGIVKEARIKAMRVGKEEVKKVDTGSECGILLYPQVDVREKDSIIAYNKSNAEI